MTLPSSYFWVFPASERQHCRKHQRGYLGELGAYLDFLIHRTQGSEKWATHASKKLISYVLSRRACCMTSDAPITVKEGHRSSESWINSVSKARQLLGTAFVC